MYHTIGRNPEEEQLNVFINAFSTSLNSSGSKPGFRCCATQGLAAITGLALFIIGCMGAAGAFPGAAIGWVTLGLSGGIVGLQFAQGNLKQRKFELIIASLMAVCFITVGALGGAGVLSATQVGWGIIGTILAAIPLHCANTCITARRAFRSLNS